MNTLEIHDFNGGQLATYLQLLKRDQAPDLLVFKFSFSFLTGIAVLPNMRIFGVEGPIWL